MFAGTTWSWAPRCWDPQCSTAAVGATFSSPPAYLPSWLSWKDNVLSGEAPESAIGSTIELKAVATFIVDGETKSLAVIAKIVVAAVGDFSGLL